MPGILRDFLTVALGITVFAGPAVLADLVLALLLLPTPGLAASLANVNTSAYLEAPAFGWGPPLSLGELFTQAVIRVPYALPLNVALCYIAARSILAAVGFLRGDTQALTGLLRGVAVVWVGFVVFLMVFNQGAPLLRPTTSTYAANVQYTIPSNVSRLGSPPVFLLSEFSLAVIPHPTETRVFRLPATAVFGLIGITAVAYVVATVVYVLYLLALALLVLVQVVGRWIFVPAMLVIAAMPILSMQATLRRIANWIVGLVLCSVVIVPFTNYLTDGVLFALPALTAQLASGAAARVVNAIAALGAPPSGFNPSAFCEALLISDCGPFQNPSAPLSDADLSLLQRRFAGLAALTVVLLVIEALFIGLVVLVLMQSAFVGTVVAGGIGGMVAGKRLEQAIASGWDSALAIPVAGKLNAAVARVAATRDTTTLYIPPPPPPPQSRPADKDEERRKKAAALRAIGAIAGMFMPAAGPAAAVAAELVESGDLRTLKKQVSPKPESTATQNSP